jgi:hypothetical protein
VLTEGVQPTDVGELVSSRLEPLVGAAVPAPPDPGHPREGGPPANPAWPGPVVGQLNLVLAERSLRVEAGRGMVRTRSTRCGCGPGAASPPAAPIAPSTGCDRRRIRST